MAPLIAFHDRMDAMEWEEILEIRKLNEQSHQEEAALKKKYEYKIEGTLDRRTQERVEEFRKMRLQNADPETRAKWEKLAQERSLRAAREQELLKLGRIRTAERVKRRAEITERVKDQYHKGKNHYVKNGVVYYL
jgi:hypothetical protein